MVSEMLNRVARAIDPNAFAAHDDMESTTWKSRRQVAESKARRAVEAMREPTRDVAEAGAFCEQRTSPIPGAIDTWNAMIAEILKC